MRPIIEEGTKWCYYDDCNELQWLLVVRILYHESCGELPGEVLSLVAIGPKRYDNGTVQIRAVTFPLDGVMMFMDHRIFVDKAAADKDKAAKLRQQAAELQKQADAVESM